MIAVVVVDEQVLEGESFFFFFFNDTATTEIYTLSLHDALPIWISSINARPRPCAVPPWICPTTANGFIARPTSCAVVISTTLTSPSSVSTSTTARCAANAYWTCAFPCPVRGSSADVGRCRHVTVSSIGSASPCESIRARTASHAARTAPPVTYVCRDADVEPAEPIDVSGGSSTTRSTPSSVRTIWLMTVTSPWPTSAAAVCTEASGSPLISSRRTRATAKSSNPSEKPTFLMPMPYPIPRRTDSPCVAFDAPPGRSSTSRIASGKDGSDTECTRRSNSATGAAESTTCPVGIVDPSCSALRTRTSTGPSPHASARRSICDSYAKQACTAPNPRIAPHGGLFVYATRQSITTFGTSYGPKPSVAALAATAVEDDAYAPPSSTIQARA